MRLLEIKGEEVTLVIDTIDEETIKIGLDTRKKGIVKELASDEVVDLIIVLSHWIESLK